ncbi:hypothetical protein R3P38DRAFT_3252081 [Favolaschia claudopus]|uniref:Uncharacterized protein n=1 Tax=Favolaschia claudopus TaxID=2862362 RepID=A0AAW0E7L1_9AGAR
MPPALKLLPLTRTTLNAKMERNAHRTIPLLLLLPPHNPHPPLLHPHILRFTLGFLYTGILVFVHRTYDVSTALTLLLSASHFALPTLYTEVSARVITEMVHGLFHAALPFTAYEELTRGPWRAGGCICCKCAGRVPRILEFALRDDVKGSRPRAREPARARGVVRDSVGRAGVFRLVTTIARWVCGHPRDGNL